MTGMDTPHPHQHSAPLPQPPTTRGLPLLGSLPAFLRNQLGFLENARGVYGDIYKLNLGFTSVVMLNRPEYAAHVLRDHARNYSKGGPVWETIRTLIGNGLPVSEGDFWLRQRRMMSPQFHRKRLEGLTQHMTAAIDDGISNWEAYVASGEPLDLAAEFAKVTMKVIVKTMFGAGISAEDAEIVAQEMAYMLGFMLRGMLTQSLPRWLPMPGRQRYQNAINTIDKIVYDLIERRRKGADADQAGDMLALLLHMVDEETGEQMTDQQLRDEAVTLFLAGYETTSVSMAWSFHYLMQHPQSAARLQQEVDAILGGREPQFADLPQLTYARMIMQEALRLYGPIIWIARTAVEEDVIDGYRIRPRQMVGVVPYVIHRHPNLWQSPADFDPERFAPHQTEGRHQLAWMPFGAGQRQCIGRDFALMEGQLILAKVAQRYNLHAAPQRITQPRAALTLSTKGGVWAVLEKRT